MARTSRNYRFTLPVVHGVIQVCRAENALVEKDTRLVVDLKYRGPRFGRHYTTSPDCAYAVDVYLRERREWSY